MGYFELRDTANKQMAALVEQSLLDLEAAAGHIAVLANQADHSDETNLPQVVITDASAAEG